MNSQIDFGYPWWLSHRHLVVTAVALCFLLLACIRRWPRMLMLLIGALMLWSAAAFCVARFVLDFNGWPPLPTERFLASGTGRVLDMGAGTGRSTLMVLESRPQTSIVALDLFGQSYEQHFGSRDGGRQRILSNLRAAGVEQRATVQAGDMRSLPFEPDAFDAIISAYAIDHLNREGIDQSLREASRVLKPGGEFLLMLIAKDAWLKFSFGPLLLHSGTRGAEWWTGRLQAAGFKVLEHGTRPATLYLLSRKP